MANNMPGVPQESPRVSRKLPSLINSVSKVTLPQYRAQSILDIAGRVVQAESVDQFLDELLPYPSSRKRALRIPKRPRIDDSKNPFRTLEKAGNMSEDKVVRHFVSTPAVGCSCSQAASHIHYRYNTRPLPSRNTTLRQGWA